MATVSNPDWTDVMRQEAPKPTPPKKGDRIRIRGLGIPATEILVEDVEVKKDGTIVFTPFDERREARQRLASAGAQLAAADEARTQAMEAVKTALVASRGMLPLAQAADLANVSRPTAYKLLGDAK